MADSRPNWESIVQLGAVLGLGLLFCMTLVVFACEIGLGQAATVVAADSEKIDTGGSEEVLAALRGAGGIVRPAGEPAGQFDEPFFRTVGRVVEVDGAQVMMFEYRNQRDRERESELISADGSSVGSTHITWTDQPNFWASGRVIVQYLGSDRAVLSLLHNALGTPITTHEQISQVARSK